MTSPFDSDAEETPTFSPLSTPILTRKYEKSDQNAWCCETDKLLHSSKEFLIQITDSEKVSEMGSTFISYSIKIGGNVIKRRYSEFESMRKILIRLYPYIIVPPIPEKHSISDYARMQSKAKDDPSIIDLRKRMLQSFLNNVCQHEILGSEHLFHRFLETGAWADVLFSQKIYKKEGKSSPSGKLGLIKKLKNPDLKFLELEQSNDKFFDRIYTLEKDNKRIYKNIHDLGSVYGELGAIFNGFSLHETDSNSLSQAIEKVGQAMDSSLLTCQIFSKELDEQYGDFLHEALQFTEVAKDILKRRHNKHYQFEELGDQLDSKRIHLAALEKDPSIAAGIPQSNVSGFGKMMMNFGDKLQQMMDSNPEMTRRNQVAKLKDTISNIESTREESHTELLKYSEQVQQEINRFNLQREKILKSLLLKYARIQKQWFQKNIDSWQKAAAQVEKI